MKIIKNWLFKAVFITIIPFLIGIIDNAGNWKNEDGIIDNIFYNGKIFVIIFSIIYLLYVIFIAYSEYNTAKITYNIDKAEKCISTYSKILTDFSNIFDTSQKEINKIANEIKSKGSSDLLNWNFEYVSNCICKDLLESLKDISENGHDISVNIYKKTSERLNKRCNEYITMIAHHGGHNSQPKILNTKKLLNSCREYEYAKPFVNSNPKIIIHETEEKISKHFKYNDDIAKYKGEYTQYINIPIACSGGNILFLLEIITHHNTIILQTKEELLSMVNSYVKPYKQFLLMAHKIEKALLQKNEGELNDEK